MILADNDQHNHRFTESNRIRGREVLVPSMIMLILPLTFGCVRESTPVEAWRFYIADEVGNLFTVVYLLLGIALVAAGTRTGDPDVSVVS